MKLDEIQAADEPPTRDSSIVLIGKNSRGNWVAQQQQGLYGGLFIDRTSAVRYALFENGHHPESIVAVSSVLELEIGGPRPSPETALPYDHFPRLVA